MRYDFPRDYLNDKRFEDINGHRDASTDFHHDKQGYYFFDGDRNTIQIKDARKDKRKSVEKLDLNTTEGFKARTNQLLQIHKEYYISYYHLIGQRIS